MAFFVVTRVWLGLGFLKVFKGCLPSRASEHTVGRAGAARCRQAGCTHAGKNIFWGAGSASAGVRRSWRLGALIPGTPDLGICPSFPQGRQVG